jgi:hypothetical protein
MKTTKFFKSGGEAPTETPKLPAPTRPKSRRPQRITLWVVVPVAEHRTAERVAKGYADEGLEELLAAFVSDLVTAEERPGSWEAERINGWLSSHVWPKREREWEERRKAREAKKEGV